MTTEPLGGTTSLPLTTYPALHRLERQGWIDSDWGLSENNRKAKYYQLTVRGRAQLRAEVATWNRYTKAVAGVLEPA